MGDLIVGRLDDPGNPTGGTVEAMFSASDQQRPIDSGGWHQAEQTQMLLVVAAPGRIDHGHPLATRTDRVDGLLCAQFDGRILETHGIAQSARAKPGGARGDDEPDHAGDGKLHGPGC